MGDTVLVTGGAGYVGSHTCLALAEAGFKPVVYDNLSNGRREFVLWGPFIEGDVRDRAALDAAFDQFSPVAVMHFAALIEVGESVRQPAAYYDTNVTGALNVIGAARAAGIDRIVFSSTCATYGSPVHVPMAETHPQAPLNPYGRSKLMVEQILADLDQYAGFRSAILRYFNAAGADPDGRIGEQHEPETHAIPLALLAALGQRDSFRIFGTDYETRDGTALRDYVHVLDLADAHVLALRHLLANDESLQLNLGTGIGVTVRELVEAIRRVTGRSFPVETVGRRPGDAAALVADSAQAKQILGWCPTRDIHCILESAWRWHAGRENGAC